MSQAALKDIAVFLQYRSWKDVVDIIVVSFLLYRLLMLIRGTRAGQLILGIAVLTLPWCGNQYDTPKMVRFCFWSLSTVEPGFGEVDAGASADDVFGVQ